MIRGLFCLLFPKKSFEELDGGQLTFRQTAYVLAVPVIDRMADKGIIHKNKAARHKSRLNGHVKALNVAAAA
jgi:small subunit ribosomal protein S20